MISLLLNRYNKEELEMLERFLYELNKTASCVTEQETNCKACMYSHLCSDLAKAHEFVVNYRKENGSKIPVFTDHKL